MCVIASSLLRTSLAAFVLIVAALSAEGQVVQEYVADLQSPAKLLALSASPVIVRSVTLSIPAAGNVIAIANGLFRFSDAAIAETGACTVSTQASGDSDGPVLQSREAPPRWRPFRSV